ncbi:MAG: ribonuclease J [Candidatus Methylomirabilales bacterium]
MPGNEWVRIIPLGGLGEIGMNMFVVETADDMVVIDAGLMFPEEEMLGIDLVIPDFSYLLQHREKVRGLILTHGHEDHTGSLPFLLKELSVPVYGTPLSLGLAAEKIRELNVEADLRKIMPRDRFTLGGLPVECMRVCHSIPDGVGIALETPAGIIIHAGDFKFDPTPVDGELTDYHKFAELGDRGVLVLLSDSTNALRPGVTPSERTVGRALEEIFRTVRRRIIVACFASHIHRIQQILEVAARMGKRVAIHGKSMIANTRIAADMGYLSIPPGVLVRLDELRHQSPGETVIIATGSQGEPLSAIARMAAGEHKQIEITPGDTVIFSARVIPGNEKSIARTINRLLKRGAEVITEEQAPVHVSGHPCQEELKLMLNLTRPKFLVPVHGEYRHRHHHARLAMAVGIDPDHICLAENGDILEFTPETGSVVGKVGGGRILVDGKGVGDVGDAVLRERQRLAKDGMVVVTVGLDPRTRAVVVGPEIIARGFVDVHEQEVLFDAAKQVVCSVLAGCPDEDRRDIAILKEHVTAAVRKFIQKSCDRRPMVLPVIIEVEADPG